MCLDLRHQIFQRLIGVDGAGARGQRKIAELRRSEREIEGNRCDRQSHQRQNGRRTAQFEVRLRRQIALTVHGRQQAAADFDARGLGLGDADQAGGDVAVDLGKLIPVDDSLAAARLGAALRLNGQSTAKIAATVISANTNHSVIKRFPGGTARSKASADAPLYTTGGKPGN